MRVIIILYLTFLVVSAKSTNGGAGRIIGGSLTTIQNYPFAAAILSSANSATFRQDCGGAIMNTRSILTAAHCLPGPRERYRVRLGSSFSSSGGQVYNTAQIINHPNYNRPAFDNDIGILRTATQIFYSNSVAPGRIAGSNYIVRDNEPVMAIGWGLTSTGPNAQPSEQLRHVRVTKLNRQVCRQRMNLLTDNMMCTLGTPGTGTCTQDSGGPVLHGNVIVGITSFGTGCATGFSPDINVRVARFTNWISSNV